MAYTIYTVALVTTSPNKVYLLLKILSSCLHYNRCMAVALGPTKLGSDDSHCTGSGMLHFFNIFFYLCK